MKKFLLSLILAAVTFSGFAQNIGEAFYVYRNDGEFNAFFRDEVQSIEYSYEDADGKTYDEIITQVITTADSVYKIPLSVIDSVAFVQPGTIYKEGVKELSGNILDYIVSVEGSSIFLRSDTPSDLIPLEGEKLVQLYYSETFPDGFSGKIISVKPGSLYIEINCESVPIEDVVKRFYGAYRITSTNGATNFVPRRSNNTKSKGLFEKTFEFGKINLPINLEGINIWRKVQSPYETSLGGALKLSFELEPVIDIRVVAAFDEYLGIVPVYNIHICTHYDNKESLTLSGQLSGEFQQSFLPMVTPIPLIPGVFFLPDVGFKLSGNGEFGVGVDFSQRGYCICDADIYPTVPSPTQLFLPAGIPVSAPLIVPKSIKVVPEKPSDNWAYLYGNIEARIAAYLDLGIAVLHKNFIRVGAEFDLGARFDVNMSHNIADWSDAERSTSYYDHQKDNSKVDCNFYCSGEIYASAFENLNLFYENSGKGLRVGLGGEVDLGDLFHHESYLLPEFKNVRIVRNANKPSTFTATANIVRSCLLPMQVGFALYNSNNKLVKTAYFEKKYYNPQSFSNFIVDLENINIDENETYMVYPIVTFLNKDILATPYSLLEEPTVKITGFKITSSDYSKSSFEYKGNKYDFRHKATVTALLDGDISNVDDWGYVYEDINGDTAHVSLLKFTPSYTDTRYDYYRNTPISSATLYGYIRYKGSEAFKHTEKVNYDLIYDKLPLPKTDDLIEVGETTAKVKCAYQEAAPWSGTCGIEYWEDTHINDSKKIYFDTAQEEIEVILDGLKPNTTYYYQALIKVDDKYVGDVTGIEKNEILADEIMSFTTKPVFILTTGEVKDKTANSATLSGTVENYAPNEETFQFAFFYSTSSDVMNSSDGKSAVATYDNNGNLTAEISGLKDYTTYYYTLAVKRGESAFEPSETKSFTTLPVVSTVNNATTTSNSATLNGTCSKGITITGFSVKKDGASDYTSYSATVDGNGNFSATVDGLESSTTYHYYAFIRDGEQSYLGEEYSFTTKERLVAITLGLDEIDDTKAYVKCNYIKPQDQYVWCGVEYWDETMEQPIMKERYFFNTEEEAIVLISNLKPKTKYYYRALISDGNEYIRADETRSFTTLNPLCPDDNHPHMIDLGLPSGTKWACCNVGADNPEGFGGYYAWGETEEKSRYDTNNYLLTYIDNEKGGIWRDPDTGNYFSIIDIGSDIAGTEYDVATVKWGSGWTMPSRQQIMELREYCEAAWGRGRRTMKFIGSNGNFIILPDAGNKTSSGTVTSFNGMGFYWSSSASLDDETYHQWAFILRFDHRPQIDKINMDSDRYNRSMGFSVRPVHK
jgi:hypothetical protein